jgi:hypothetical protein
MGIIGWKKLNTLRHSTHHWTISKIDTGGGCLLTSLFHHPKKKLGTRPPQPTTSTISWREPRDPRFTWCLAARQGAAGRAPPNHWRSKHESQVRASRNTSGRMKGTGRRGGDGLVTERMEIGCRVALHAPCGIPSPATRPRTEKRFVLLFSHIWYLLFTSTYIVLIYL